MIDAHIHLDDQRFDKDREQLIQESIALGITTFVTPAVSYAGFEKLKLLSQKYDAIRPAYGLHPYFIDQHQEPDLIRLDEWLDNNHSIALGECGLDLFYKHLDKNKQQWFFEAQIQLAKKHNLPLILHARNAVEAVYDALTNANYYNAMIHSYNGSIEQTKRLLNQGIKFSFGGAICNPNAHKLHKLIRYCPQDAVMFETDAPDQNIYPDFKFRNEPKNLLEVIEKYSEITYQDLDDVRETSEHITCEFFNI